MTTNAIDLCRFSLDMDGSMEPDEHGRWVRFDDVSVDLDNLRAENQRLKIDADRYRVIRSGAKINVRCKKVEYISLPRPEPEYGDALDRAVDQIRTENK